MPGLPQELYSAAQMRLLDQAAVRALELGPGKLMERAGAAALNALRLRWPRARRIVVVCGPGNNGGDGFVVARQAREAGLSVRVLLPEDITPHGDAALAWDAVRASGITIEGLERAALAQADVVVDAIFGTGLTRPPGGAWRAAIHAINVAHRSVFALDIPSGINSDTGAMWESAVDAAFTLTFIGLKPGLFTGAGVDRAGYVAFDDLGVPDEVVGTVAATARRITEDNLRGTLPPRLRSAHKGDAGYVAAIGGNIGMAGAVRMAGEAAYRSGAGLVRLGTHPRHANCISPDCPELIVDALDNPAAVAALLARVDAVALGPGLGRDAWAHDIWSAAIDTAPLPVVDADALNLLAAAPRRRDDWILTPHPAEAGRLLGVPTSAVQSDRAGAARAIAQKYGGVCVLKGAGTVVSEAEGSFWLCDRGDPAMASGGMGDVLTGIIAGLRAQGMAACDAARAAVWVHARAGEEGAEAGIGLLATDLLSHLRKHLRGLGA